MGSNLPGRHDQESEKRQSVHRVRLRRRQEPHQPKDHAGRGSAGGQPLQLRLQRQPHGRAAARRSHPLHLRQREPADKDRVLHLHGATLLRQGREPQPQDNWRDAGGIPLRPCQPPD